MLLPEEAIEPPPFTDDDLEAYFEWADEPHDDEPGWPAHLTSVAAWSVCDTGSAEYAMRKLAHAEADEDEIAVQEAAFMAQIRRWADGQMRPHKRAINFFTGQLEAYARRKREEDKILTLNLPSGQVTSRRNPARPEVVDAEALTAFRSHLPDAVVKTKYVPVVAELKKAVKFETVRVPDFGGEDVVLVRWPGADGESVWVAVPATMVDGIPRRSEPDGSTVAAEDLPNFHDEVWPIYDGQRVPGVVQVPEEVIYTVKPAKP